MAIFQTVLAYHQRIDAQIDLERSLLLTIKQMTRECSESSWPSIETEADGFVFATPRDPSGAFSVGLDDEVAWAGFICYSLETVGAERVLRKRTEFFATPSDTIPEPNAFAPPRNVSWFLSSALPPRTAENRVELFTVSREVVGDEDGRDALKIELGAGIGDPAGPRYYTLEMNSRVRPRN